MPVIHKDAAGNYPIKMKPAQSEIQKLISHDPFSQKPGDMQHDYGVKTTAPVPVRIEKVLSADYSDLDDAANAALMADDSDSKMLHGGQRDMGGLGTWVMAGYTGHVRSRPALFAPCSVPSVPWCLNKPCTRPLTAH